MARSVSRFLGVSLLCIAFILLASCGGSREVLNGELPPVSDSHYLIGPGDTVAVFVWGNPELSATVPVRPDGRITTPLVEDVVASGKTPTELARDMERQLDRLIRNPVVTVIVTGFVGLPSEQIRVVGAATEPKTLPYRQELTLLDVMIEVGGLNEFAAGNRARIVRKINGRQVEIRARLNDLLKDGDINANIAMFPGDILIIPEAWF